MFRTLTPSQLAFDVILAVFCVLLRFAIPTIDWPLYIVVLAMGAALALRRLSPTLALIVAWVGAVLQLVAGLAPDVSNLAILPVLYATAAYGRPRTKWAGLVSAGAGAVIATVYLLWSPFYGGGAPLTEFFRNIPQALAYSSFVLGSLLAAFGLSWTLGLLARTRRLARESRRAQEIAEEEEARARQDIIVEQERNRIARDMHDVVAHSLAVVIAQADGARYAQAGDPGAVDSALTTISTTAREALGDVRILLGQLRHNQGESPQPVLADLERLLEQLRASGLTLRHEVTGRPVAAGTGVQLAVYRIVQEALTNALRHGDASQEVVVEFEWDVGSLELAISSALSSQPPMSTGLGHGLAGMRERAVLVGGWLTAEPVNGRFVVSAGIPLEGAA